MPKPISESTRPSGRAYDRDVDEGDEETMMDDDRPQADLLIAALLGAAVGAGLGLLASRAMQDETPEVVKIARSAGRSARRAVRRAPSLSGAGGAVGDVISDARSAVERAVERELRQLKRAMRRRRRELGL
jgi:hypothetical protein